MVAYAREAGKPIVIERLDFWQKKAALEGQSRKYSRMLSSFSYSKIKAYFLSRGYREGVEVHLVNPGLFQCDRQGEVYGTLRDQHPPSRCSGAGPAFARLFREYPPLAGLSRWQ